MAKSAASKKKTATGGGAKKKAPAGGKKSKANGSSGAGGAKKKREPKKVSRAHASWTPNAKKLARGFLGLEDVVLLMSLDESSGDWRGQRQRISAFDVRFHDKNGAFCTLFRWKNPNPAHTTFFIYRINENSASRRYR